MILAFTGYKGSGKSEAASYLVEHHDFVRVSFAAPLKESAAALLGVTVAELEEWKNDPRASVSLKADWFDSSDRSPDPCWVPGKVVTLSIRQFLQRYGTESHRDVFGDNFWVEQAMRHMQSLIAMGRDRIVIDDCRFENEREALVARGGRIVRIDRPGVEGGADTHPSERPLADPDLIIDNNLGIPELHRALDCLV